jgi:hypothetical protein
MTNPADYLQHLELAEEFYKAFRDLPENGPSGMPINWPRYFALCHATELALKSFLLAHGWTDQQIKDIAFRHDITNLMTEAVARGLNISAGAQSDINLLSDAHKGFWHRYPKQNGGPVFLIDQFEKPFVELLTAVTAAIRGGGRLWVHY